MRDWVRQAHSTLEQVTGLDIRETDFTDDRLTIVLRHLSDEGCWQAIEQELGQHLVRVYELEEQPVRVDATTVSGYREGGESSLWQFGYSKDDPTLRQIKAMRLCCKNSQRNTMGEETSLLVGFRPPLQTGGR